MNTSSHPTDRRERGTATKEAILVVAMQLLRNTGMAPLLPA